MTDASDELENLIALANRLIPGAAPWGQFGVPEVIRPGRPAPELPPDVPLPPDSRVVGSYTSGSSSMTLLDAAQGPIEVVYFYTREMDAAGWTRRDSPGGFQPPEQKQFRLQFCRSTQGPALTILISERQGRCVVTLLLLIDPEHGPCGRPNEAAKSRGGLLRHSSPLPVLVPPAGSAMGMYGQGPALGQYNSNAEMTSDLDLTEMVEHFSASLREWGWHDVRRGGTGPVAWSTWSCRDESGERVEGSLLVIENGENRYTLQVNRDVAPGSREEAERRGREYARTAAQQAERRPARVEIELLEGDATAALREMILRTAAPEGSHLLVGCLPEDLHARLPLPPRTRLVGSLVTGMSVSVYLGGQAQPQEIEAFYRTEFASTAWSVRDESHRIDGFSAQPAGSGIDYLFCPRNEGMAFRVRAYSRPDGAEAMIHVFGDQETSPCRDRPGWPRGGRGVHQSPLPTLSAPPNTDFYGGADHGGEDSWESNGYLFRAPDSGEILAWYGEQFSADGWTETDRSQDEVIAWSRWRKGTESALFLAVRWPATDVYHLIARATRLPGSADVPAE